MTAPRRKKILIADDDLVVLKVLSLKLSSIGFEVVKVFDSAEVTRRIAEELPDLVLLDLDFGPTAAYTHVEWDGFKMLDWLMRLEELARIPIIVVTANESPEAHKRCLGSGAAAVFPKPLDFDALRAEIERLTGTNK